jgi:hypothetical protein
MTVNYINSRNPNQGVFVRAINGKSYYQLIIGAKVKEAIADKTLPSKYDGEDIWEDLLKKCEAVNSNKRFFFYLGYYTDIQGNSNHSIHCLVNSIEEVEEHMKNLINASPFFQPSKLPHTCWYVDDKARSIGTNEEGFIIIPHSQDIKP